MCEAGDLRRRSSCRRSDSAMHGSVAGRRSGSSPKRRRPACGGRWRRTSDSRSTWGCGTGIPTSAMRSSTSWRTDTGGRVAQALQRFPAPDAVHVLFTAHSLPERILATGDRYPDELRASAAAVAKRAGLAAWSFAYQSAGATPEPWLGPEAGAVMTELAGQGRRAFLIVPIGFVSDHVEVLYDVDVMYRELAGRLGVRFERTTSLNDDPLLVGALAEIARATAAARGWT